jgi:RNA polymerase sigma-70 factor (ECF subfamily)
MTEGISNAYDAANGVVPVEGITDTEIVGRVLAGDDPLYGLIMRRYNRFLFRLARSIVQDDDEARDVVQVAYISAYYHLGQFRGPAGLRAWLSRIAINEACARTRRAPAFADEERVLRVTGGDAAEPENAAITSEALRILEIAIDRLPDEFRSVFMLRGVEQLSVTETAELLDIKPATVKTRFHRARRLLQQSLRRKLNGTASQAFPFDGQRCNAIVANVLAKIHSMSNADTGDVACFRADSLC